MKKKRILRVLVLLLIAAGAVAFYYYKLPVSECPEYRFFINPDDTQDSVIQSIQKADPDARTKALTILLDHYNYNSRIRTGCYTLKSGATPKEVCDMLLSGQQTPVKIIINSTRSVEQMARSISGQIMADSAQIAQLLKNPAFLDSLGYSTANVYCMIIPNTYEVYWNISPKALINRLIKERDRFWNEQRKAKAKELGLSEQDVITLASIIEEETTKSDELPMIAGVYMNRLKKRLPLQACPTVIFAMGGERPKRILKKHLEFDSPYNTYKHLGLPPGPIRFVSTRSIDAVLNHTKHNYLYFCAKEDFSGYHNFSTTLAQHNAYAARYQRALDKAGIY